MRCSMQTGLLVALCSAHAAIASAAEPRMNVLVVIADDLGWADVTVNRPETFYETPSLERLAAGGVAFTNGYAASPVCSPSRVSIMTGRYPVDGAMTEWFGSGRPRSERFGAAAYRNHLPIERETFADLLSDRGYQTFFAGKWHLGDGAEYLPSEQGFDRHVAASGRGNPGADGFFAPYQPFMGLDGPEGEHLPVRLTDETIEFIGSRDPSRPFLAVLSYYSVHTPLQAPGALIEKHRHRAARRGLSTSGEFAIEEQVWPGRDARLVRSSQDLPVYAAMVEAMDAQIGRLLDAIETEGLAENTLIIFVSDNGGLSSAEGSPTSNLPLRGGKGWLYEGGIRVPFIVRWPGVADTGEAVDTPVHTNDILPSIVDAAGVDNASFAHGRSVRETLENPANDRPLFFHYPHYSNQGGFPGAALRRGEWKLIQRYESGRAQLFHLPSDPSEENDLAADEPMRVASMTRQLHEHLEALDARFLSSRNAGPDPWLPPFARPLKLHGLISDGAVLQASADVRIWGHAASGSSVSISPSWASAPVVTNASEDGTFEAVVRTPAAGGPHTIVASDGRSTIEVGDVLVGEVWIASGQSNMEMPVAARGRFKGALNWRREVSGSHDPWLRVFDVPNRVSSVPVQDVRGRWEAAGASTTGDFSATAYFFARHLREHLGVPVGIITADWGGTRAEAWMPDAALRGLRRVGEELLVVRAVANHPGGDEAASIEHLAREQPLDDVDPGIREGWATPDFAVSSEWEQVGQPGVWEDAGLPGFDGVVWLRRTVTIPDGWVGRDLSLRLGAIDDQDTTWVNGAHVGSTRGQDSWRRDRTYRVPASVVTSTNLSIAVRVVDTGGGGGLRAEPGTMRLAQARGSDQTVSLDGPWFRRVAMSAEQLPTRAALHRNSPTVLFNAMISAIRPYSCRGFVWYQGESNRAHADDYGDLMNRLIESWREAWGDGGMPFHFVQIAPHDYDEPDDRTARLRDRQRLAVRLPETAMVVTADIGDANDIHPRDKRSVGERLALAALATTYAREEVGALSPLPTGASRDGGDVVISFAHAGSLRVRGAVRPVGFELQDSSGAWHEASALVDGVTVRVASEEVETVVGVRFLWSDTPFASLFNEHGLPASPFEIMLD